MERDEEDGASAKTTPALAAAATAGVRPGLGAAAAGCLREEGGGEAPPLCCGGTPGNELPGAKTSIFATGTTPASVGMQPPNASPPPSEWPAILAGPVGLPWTKEEGEEEDGDGEEEAEAEASLLLLLLRSFFFLQVRVGRCRACASPKNPAPPIAAGEPPETTSQGAASASG